MDCVGWDLSVTIQQQQQQFAALKQTPQLCKLF